MTGMPKAEARAARWVEPRLLAEIEFTEVTPDGFIRHPSFKGLREDKAAHEVVRERPAAATAKPAPQPTPARRVRAAKSNAAAVASVPLTHADRVLYPDQGLTKLDLARFYESIADWILPQLQDRPTTLVRCPEGLAKTCFYQKHVLARPSGHRTSVVGRSWSWGRIQSAIDS